MKGSYVLLLKLSDEQIITVGRRQDWRFLAGYYAYVGSAMGGFRSRLSRHLKSQKKLHWHIDYLLEKAVINHIILCESNHRLECTIAQTLSHHFEAIPSFGSSDCKCASHLFFTAEGMSPKILSLLNLLGIRPSIVDVGAGEKVR